jgi:organic radical activating enzyme
VKTYAIKEIFNTVQGEGSRAGERSVFVRFAGCNLWNGLPEGRAKGRGACARWCDSDFANGEKLTAYQIIERMDACWSDKSTWRWCVITGGEPLLQADADLLHALKTSGWRIALETNGTLNPVADDERIADLFDHITLSPKLGTEDVLMLRRCTDLKVVLPGAVRPEAGWTEEKMRKLERTIDAIYRYVQPQDPVEQATVSLTHLTSQQRDTIRAAEYTANEKACLDWVMQNPSWRISLQTHKFMGVP